jgi:pyruvate dehydrogenase E2 component (dihydrolipoamide acetyltransferase)
MATPVMMPRQGQSVETCILTKWFKQKGEQITEGEPLFSYETDKASFEEAASTSGILLETFFDEDDEVPVLVNIGVIGSEGEDTEEFRPAAEQGEPAPAPAADDAPAQTDTPSSDTSEAAPAAFTSSGGAVSPRAMRLADTYYVPVHQLAGTGPEGRIIERDVEKAIADGKVMTSLAYEKMKQEVLSTAGKGKGPAGRILASDLVSAGAAAGGTVSKISNMRKIISKKMHESLQTAAQLTLHSSADARRMLALRKEIKTEMNTNNGPNISLNDMVCYAAAKVLPEFPDINAHFLGDSVKTFAHAQLGIAVDTDRGLMVPTVRNADLLSAADLGAQIKKLAEDCRTGNIDPELLSGGSFTITNLGTFGIEMFTPVLNTPQVGILGVNTISYKPADIGGGAIGFVPHIGLSLTFDHRALDGAPAAKFLQSVKNKIENLELT